MPEQLFAWQKFSLRIPEDWVLARYEGDAARGYLRIDDEDMVRVELKWETATKVPDLEKMVERYLKGTAKEMKKSRLPFTSERHLKLVKFPGKRFELFRWRGECECWCFVTWCAECGRVVIGRLICREYENSKELARSIFGSFRDHPDGEYQRWAVFGLDCSAPKQWVLVQSSLRPGLAELEFDLAGERIRFTRVSIAHIVLQGKTIEQWYREFFEKRLRPLGVEFENTTHRGHTACRATGKQRRTIPFLGPARLEALIWLCEPEDKVFALSYFGKKGMDLSPLARLFRCHREEG